jgi:hypothetical protein
MEALNNGKGLDTEVMIARSCIGEAIHTAVPIAHQVHGAIGFTEEHLLHYSTRRLWSWREEFGNENQWAGKLGKKILEYDQPLFTFITNSKVGLDQK